MFGPLATIVRDTIPNYLRSVPIPYTFGDMGDMSLMEWAHFATFAGVSGFTGYALYQKCMAKPVGAGRCNTLVQLSDAKVVHAYDIEDMADKEVYCRCWKSKKFPYCDGAHAKHNKETGDNVGPLIIKKKTA